MKSLQSLLGAAARVLYNNNNNPIEYSISKEERAKYMDLAYGARASCCLLLLLCGTRSNDNCCSCCCGLFHQLPLSSPAEMAGFGLFFACLSTTV